MNLKLPAVLAIVALLITMAFVLWPTPYLMLAFAFFAQPLFLIVIILYLRRVFRDLREKEVL
jgi:hypothetical protein